MVFIWVDMQRHAAMLKVIVKVKQGQKTGMMAW